MKTLIENAPIIILLILLLAIAIHLLRLFLEMPKEKQLSKVREWLLYWVVKAEKEFGGGTGQVKLRYVYDEFVKSFPDLAELISFESFSLLVDQALERMRTLLKSNENLRKYVESKDEQMKNDISQMQQVIDAMKELGKTDTGKEKSLPVG